MTDTTGTGAGAARPEPWTEYRQMRDNDRAREERGGPTREHTQADDYYRSKIGDPDRMRSIGADQEDRNTSTTVGDMRAALEERMDRRIATLREAGVSPDAIYVQARHELTAHLATQTRQDLAAAELLSHQGVSSETLTAHMRATIDAGDAVAAGLHAKVYPQQEAEVQPEREDPRLARMTEMREQGIPDSVIATQMRAELMQGSSAAAQPAQQGIATPESQGRLARFTARVTGRGAGQEAESR
jgi:hypothetical protein